MRLSSYSRESNSSKASFDTPCNLLIDGVEYLSFPPSVWELNATSYWLGAPPWLAPKNEFVNIALIDAGLCDMPCP
jgi:hypothetical protein